MTSLRNRSKQRKESSKSTRNKKPKKSNANSDDDSTMMRPHNDNYTRVSNDLVWTPSSYVALKALISARLCSAIWSIINDCDETYNYWEPTHFLLYGRGFQTWEYSPVFALRSYTYLMLHAAPAFLYSAVLQPNRILVFFFLRCVLALLSALCELYFYRGIYKVFGPNVARITLGLSIFSAGMFISSTAFLPSSFAMYMTMFSYGAWFNGRLQLAIFGTALSTFVGWPFAAIIGLPIAFDILVVKRRFHLFFKWSFISAFTILVPMVQYDSAFFGRLVVAPLNLVLYNVFSSSSKGPDLYGTAPVSFYLVNGFLNFNVLFPLAVGAVPLYVLLSFTKLIQRRQTLPPIWLSVAAPIYLWFSVFFCQPHKEERFLFPVYPLIIFAAAFGVDTVQRMFNSFSPSFAGKGGKKGGKKGGGNNNNDYYLLHRISSNWIAVSLVVLSSVVSLSRIVAQYQGYRAPIDTFLELNRLEREELTADSNLGSINVCYGREWHRFPSSFFLPTLKWKVKFIESEFRGQLPQPFAASDSASSSSSSVNNNATSVIPTHMNDRNEEEKSRYVPLSSCHFLIDVDRETETPREPRYSLQTSRWKVIHRVPFLDANRSPRLFRAFYVPMLTESVCSYVDYVILQSRQMTRKVPR